MAGGGEAEGVGVVVRWRAKGMGGNGRGGEIQEAETDGSRRGDGEQYRGCRGREGGGKWKVRRKVGRVSGRDLERRRLGRSGRDVRIS